MDGIKQYQNEEFETMRAEFERVEQLLASNAEPNSREPLSTDLTQLQDHISENQPQFVAQYHEYPVKNHYRYVKWTIIFFVVLFFGVLTQMYLGRLADKVSGIMEFLYSKSKT